MTVTEVTKVTGTRWKIGIDGRCAFALSERDLELYGIREGEELKEEACREILEKVLPKRAKVRCMNLLKTRDYTAAQLRERLKRECYPEDAIEAAIEYVSSFRYVDDLRYAEDYIAAHEDARSRQRINRDLAGKGISGETLERAWELWQEKGGRQDEEAMIRALLEKRRYCPEEADERERQRTYAFLLRRGYQPEQIRRVMHCYENL